MHLDTKFLPESTAVDSAFVPAIKSITADLLNQELATRANAAKPDLSALIASPHPYVIGNGDQLSILVWDHPELSIATAAAQAMLPSGVQGAAQSPSAFVVDQGGIIQFPFIGAIRLAGLTELQARDLLAKRLILSIKRPDITLRVLSFRSKRIYIDGEVKTPGNQPIEDVPMTLLEAVTRAGGFLPTADQSNLMVTRAGVAYSVSLPALVKDGIDPSRILLAPGDVVHVRSRDENKVYVLGEVGQPKALPMVNGVLSLAQALGESGGLNPLTSAARQIYVVRNATGAKPIIYNLDARSPVALALADRFELNPRDVVYVDASDLARFNRVLNLIIPTAAAATTSYSQVK